MVAWAEVPSALPLICWLTAASSSEEEARVCVCCPIVKSGWRIESTAVLCHGFQLDEAKEPASTLDRVDSAKDAREFLLIAGLLLQCHQVAVQLIQVFGTLDEEFLDDGI